MFRLDKLTQKAQDALQQTQALAEQNGSQVMYPLHLLIALAQEQEGIVRPVLEKCGVQPDAIVAEATRQLSSLPKTANMQPGMYLAPPLNQSSNRPSMKPSASRTNSSPPSTFCSASPSSAASPPANCWTAPARPTTPS